MATSKRRLIEQVAAEATKQFVDRGKLIEAGYVAFEILVIPKDAPEIQRREMRLAFMAGADHLFASIVGMLDEDADPTPSDLRRMEQIHKELEYWRAQFSERIQPAQGKA